MPLFVNKSQNKYNRIPANSVKDLLANQNITLFGDAGSGKSTLIKHLFLDCIRSKYKIPIKIELRFLSAYSGTLIDYIKLEVFKLQHLAKDSNIIERLLESGDFIIFLDGYDEIKPSEKERVTRDIENLVKVFSENKYFLTTRPYTKVDLITGFNNYEVLGLRNDDINEFITKQSTTEPGLGEKMIRGIRQSDAKNFHEFFSNPLLLSMFILTFRRYHNIPNKRSVFYSQVFHTLYAEHNELSKPG